MVSVQWRGCEKDAASRWTSVCTWSMKQYFQFIEIVGFLSELFRWAGSDETISGRDETIFRFPRRTAETLQRYQARR